MKNCQISGPGVSGLLTGVCLHTLILLEMYSVSNAFSFQFSRGTAEQKVQNWWSGHPKCDNFNATHNLWWQKDSDNKIKMRQQKWEESQLKEKQLREKHGLGASSRRAAAGIRSKLKVKRRHTGRCVLALTWPCVALTWPSRGPHRLYLGCN